MHDSVLHCGSKRVGKAQIIVRCKVFHPNACIWIWFGAFCRVVANHFCVVIQVCAWQPALLLAATASPQLHGCMTTLLQSSHEVRCHNKVCLGWAVLIADLVQRSCDQHCWQHKITHTRKAHMEPSLRQVAAVAKTNSAAASSD